MRRFPLVLVLVLCLGFALRVYPLASLELWYDEAFSALLAEKTPGEILQGTAADVQPPLFYLLLAAWQRLGREVFVQRYLSVILSMVSLSLVYPLARRLLNRRAAIWGVFLVALSPFQIAYAHEMRMYALLECALLLYLYAFARMLTSRARPSDIVLCALSGAAALYAQSLAVFAWLVPDVYALMKRDWRALKPLLLAQALSLLLFAPWALVMAGQYSAVQRNYWIARPGLADLLQLLIAFTTSLPVPDWYVPIALFAALSAAAALGVALAREIKRGMSVGLGLLTTLMILPPLLVLFVSFVSRPIFLPRGLIVSGVGFLMLFGWFIARGRAPLVRWAAAGVIGLVVCVPILFQAGYAEFPRSPFRRANELVKAHLSGGEVVVHDNKLSFFPMHYHDRELPQVWLRDPIQAGSNTLSDETARVLGLAPTELEAAAGGRERVWFVIFRRAIEEAGGETEHPNLGWLDAKMHRVSTVKANDLFLLLYEQRNEPAQAQAK